MSTRSGLFRSLLLHLLVVHLIYTEAVYATTCVRRTPLTTDLVAFECPASSDPPGKTFCCGGQTSRTCCDSWENQMLENRGPLYLLTIITVVTSLIAIVFAFERFVFSPLIKWLSTSVKQGTKSDLSQKYSQII